MTALEQGVALVDDTLGGVFSHFDSQQARVMLLAIALQESRFTARRQHGNGPARGFWQFECGGGVRGVMNHPASAPFMKALCALRSVAWVDRVIWERLEHDDVLACGTARLLLWTDPQRLPALGDADGAWKLYQRVWRPGKPHPATWPRFYAQALDAVVG